MRITGTTLPEMADVEVFRAAYTDYVIAALGLARLYPKFSVLRVVEAHGAWRNDLDRVREREPHLQGGLDHFKQCGHLAFWLRRLAPLIDAVDLTENLADPAGHPLTDSERAFRELLFGYANEYLAFDFGFQICKFYETNKPGGSPRASTLVLAPGYYRTLCQFQKYKNVSPHAMFAIYMSLFA